MLLSELCNLEVVIAERDCTIFEAAKLMRNYNVGSLIIVEKENGLSRPVGIVTDRDLVIEVIALNIPLDSVTVGDVMSTDLISGRESDELWDTIQRMRMKGIRRIPVTDRAGNLLGIVSIDDVIELLSEELLSLSRIITQEQYREKQVRPQVV